jgi:light-regulated signal transduction histidine kinase (bacteriophytochrome)
MPNDIFDLKIKELEYGSELAQTRKLRDSSSLVVKQSLYKRQITLLARIDSVADLLEQRDFNYEAENYKNFIKNAYGSADVLKSMVKSTGDFAVGEKAEKERRVKKIEQILNWVYDQSDSIPATTHVTSTKYFPISIVPDSHTFGLTFSDTIAFAYFYAITPSRKATIKSNLKLDSTIFKKVKLPLIKGVSVANDTKQIFYLILYSEERREDKTPSFIYKVTTEGLIWSHYYSLEGVPIEATIGKENGELSLKISTNSGSKMVVIQPDGKLL